MSDPISQLGLTCPSGGDFYICQGNSTQFLGCCTSDPCEDDKGDCPQSDLRASSFNDSTYGDVTSQACAGSTSGTGDWYTCSQLDTPFLGCCATNACDDGCPTKDLVAARLSDDAKSAAVFETTTAATATASSTSVKSTTTAASASATGTSSNPSATAATEAVGTHNSASSSGLSTGAKAGIAVGAAVVVAALLAALFIFGKRCLRNRRGVVVTGSPPSVLMSNPTNSYPFHDPNRILHTPPPALSSPSLEPLAASSHASRSPAPSEIHPPHRSASSSPSRGGASAVSRHGSANYSAGEVGSPGVAAAALSQQEREAPPQGPPVAELDAASGPETTASSSGLPCSPPWSARWQPHPPSMYRPYRPSVQEFGDMKSGLYP